MDGLNVHPESQPPERRDRGDRRQTLTLPAHPELRQHAAASIARHSRRGWRIDSPNRNTNVDGVVALAMAVDAAENQTAQDELLGWL
jgi:hypothetical protein